MYAIRSYYDAWVDGSFNLKNKEYGAGALILFNGIEKEIKAKGNDKELSEMRNVAGESYNFV